MSIKIKALPRNSFGKTASRRIRRKAHIPAILYGINKNSIALSLDFYGLNKLLEYNKEIFTSIIELNIDGKKESVILKDLQREPCSNIVTHVDFLRVDNKSQITTTVPINFIGAKENEVLRTGALLNKIVDSLEVVCLAKDLPNSIDLDVSGIAMDENLSLTDIIMPEGVVIKSLTHGDIETHSQTVVSVSVARLIPEDVEEVEDAEEEDKEQQEEKDTPEDSKEDTKERKS